MDQDLLDHGRRIAALERKVSELYRRLGQEEPLEPGSGFGFPDEPATVSADEDPRLLELIRAGKKIEAIKRVRELTGLGLKEAKDFLDSL
jgi:large subunit ribosomal protein L7/L12